jgi:hypothetical protein
MGKISKKDPGEIRDFYGRKNFQSGKGVAKSGQQKKKGLTVNRKIPFNFYWLGDVDSNHDSRSQSPLSYH